MKHFFLLILCVFSTAALADGEFPHLITKADQAKLDHFKTTRKAAIAEADRGASASDRADMHALLDAKPRKFGSFDLTGSWKCRTTKIGGILPYTRYGWFNCRVTDDGAGWMLVKRSGSQKVTGRFYTASDTALHFLGSNYVDGQIPYSYGRGAKYDMVGIAYRNGAQRWRIEFPEPYYESHLDVLELQR